MNMTKKILSALLAVITLLGSVVCVAPLAVSAAEEEVDPATARLTTVYNTPEDRVAAMTSMVAEGDYELFADEITGEVAVRQLSTGQILMTNPYDLASTKGELTTKQKILSQLVIQYIDNGQTKQLYSFEEAAARGQISVLNIKHGIRVEYTIGREETRKLVPRWILRESFEENILKKLEDAVTAGELSATEYRFMMGYYQFKSVYEWSTAATKRYKDYKAGNVGTAKIKTDENGSNVTITARLMRQMINTYPICEKCDGIYVFDESAGSVGLNRVEDWIKSYCPDYSFEQLDADHEATGYESTDEKFPVFKLALEYTIGDDGFSVRVPCNGLRYDQSTYQLDYISILPYMGAGNYNNDGYNFYPDGSGSLFDFTQRNTNSMTEIKDPVYGVDYAYHTISGKYEKTIRFPVFGTVASETTFSYTYTYSSDGKSYTIVEPGVSSTVKSYDAIHEEIDKRKGTLLSGSDLTATHYKRGYVAIIEEGDSFAEIEIYQAGAESDYASMKTFFNPKPKDSYELTSSTSVSDSKPWTVVSKRKYTGSLKIHYKFLTDNAILTAALAANPGLDRSKYYETSWIGMAEYYRDYLIRGGKLAANLDDSYVDPDHIPLYIETFGALKTQQTIATIPVMVMTPLTTFEDLLTMYDELAEEGVTNINFKLTGYANGGMISTVPASLKWEKKIGGEKGFKELIEEAAKRNETALVAEDGTSSERHLGLYPDFDFAFINKNTSFDSTNLKKDAVKTIDNRYTSLRQYSSTIQSYVSFYQLAISPSRFSKFYEKLDKKYAKYDIDTMSVATLGSTLNSDFDEDDPYNREDSKGFTVEAFRYLSEDANNGEGYSLMTEGGNAYTWAYVDHIINLDLDSSRYVKASASIPFIGTVLHGHVQIAGNAFNKESDTDYALLKAIENGAGLYFILSMQNTNELKENNRLSQNYSVRYDIWKNDVADYYATLNSLLKDVQTKEIVDHRFLTGDRVLDQDELLDEIDQLLKTADEEETERLRNLQTNELIAIADAWYVALHASEKIQALLDDMDAINTKISSSSKLLIYDSSSFKKQISTVYVPNALKQLKEKAEAEAAGLERDEDGNIIPFDTKGLDVSIEGLNNSLDTIKSMAANIMKYNKTLNDDYEALLAIIDEVRNAETVISASSLSPEVQATMISRITTEYLPMAESYSSTAETKLNAYRGTGADGYLNSESENYYITQALDTMNLLTTTEPDYLPYLPTLLLYDIFTFDLDDIKEAAGMGEGGDDVTTDLEYTGNTYNNIVAVTYGTRNAATHEKTRAKTFILNYNNYAVKVSYEETETTYTIPSGGYVVIEWEED